MISAKLLDYKILKFGIVGVANTLTDLATFSVLYYLLGVPLLVANTTGYCLGVVQSFVLNKMWTFEDTVRGGAVWFQFVRFVAISLGGVVISNVVVWALSKVVLAIIAKVISIGVVFVWNYCLTRLLVFRRSS